MLVIAIMIIVAAISVPVIQSMLIDARMTAGADMMRGRLADTRASEAPVDRKHLSDQGVKIDARSPVQGRRFRID